MRKKTYREPVPAEKADIELGKWVVRHYLPYLIAGIVIIALIAIVIQGSR
jgi:hypothetical protein